MKIKLHASITATVAAILAAVGAVFGSFMLFFNFDNGIGYYKSNVLTVLFVLFCVLGLAAIIALGIVTDKETVVPTFSKASKPAKFTRGIATGVFAACAVLFAIFYLRADIKSNRLTIAIAIASAIAAAYYALSAIGESKLLQKDESSISACSILGLGTVVCMILMVGYMYFDNFIQMNAPIKTLLTFGLATAMLATLGDVRYLLSRQLARYSLATHAACTFLGITSALPIRIYSRVIKADDPAYALIALCLLALSLVSALKMKDLISPAISNEADSAETPAEEIPTETDASDDSLA